MKDIEAHVFENVRLKEDALIPYGFVNEGGVYRYSTALSLADFSCVIDIDSNGQVDGKIFEGQEEFEGYRRQMLGEYSSAIKEEYVTLLKDIRDRCFLSIRPVNYYLLPSNPRIYDVAKGFQQFDGYLNWPARKRTKPGDVVFIYSAVPFKGIAFRCLVIDVDEAGEGYGTRETFLTLLKLEQTYQKGDLPLEELTKHGLKTVRFFHKVSPEFAKYVLEKS